MMALEPETLGTCGICGTCTMVEQRYLLEYLKCIYILGQTCTEGISNRNTSASRHLYLIALTSCRLKQGQVVKSLHKTLIHAVC